MNRKRRDPEDDVKNTGPVFSGMCHLMRTEVHWHGHSATLLFRRRKCTSSPPGRCKRATQSPREEQKPQRNPQTHSILELLKRQQELLLALQKERKYKEGREGIQFRKDLHQHCETNKPNFPRDPKKMPISSINGGREKEFLKSIFGFGQTCAECVPMSTSPPPHHHPQPKATGRKNSNPITRLPLTFYR